MTFSPAMEHRIEVAPSGRATCKSCGQSIAKGVLRLGEEYASQFGDEGVAIRWHHLACGAAKKPTVLKEAMERFSGEIPDRAALEATMSAAASKKPAAAAGALPNADLAPTGRAKCIQCGNAIEKGSVRIGVEREVDTGSFTTKGAGYLHPACTEAWAKGGYPAGLPALIAAIQANTALETLPAPFAKA